MTMESMVTWLKNRGFKVTKNYISEKQTYLFDIEKDGVCYAQQFPYPSDVNSSMKDNLQREFLNKIVAEFDHFYAEQKLGIGTGVLHLPDGAHKVSIVSIDRTYGAPATFECVETPDTGGLWPKTNPYINKEATTMKNYVQITNVIFNPPATIVFWNDGTKTVVKTQDGEHFDPEKGLAMAFTKKALGNKGNYFNAIKKWTEKYEAPEVEMHIGVSKLTSAIENLRDSAIKALGSVLMEERGKSDEVSDL